MSKEDLRDWRVWLLAISPWAACVAMAAAFWTESELMALVAAPIVLAGALVTFFTIFTAPFFLPAMLMELALGPDRRGVKAGIIAAVAVVSLVISYVVFAIDADQKPAADPAGMTRPPRHNRGEGCM